MPGQDPIPSFEAGLLPSHSEKADLFRMQLGSSSRGMVKSHRDPFPPSHWYSLLGFPMSSPWPGP